MADRNSTHSTLRERIVEHVFVGETLRRLWQHGVVDVEVLRSEFDAHGYDLVMARGLVVRHIQLKTGIFKKASRGVPVALALADKPSGCVIWIDVNESLALGPFFWFGGKPGKRLPSLTDYKIPRRATHTKAGVRPERRNHRLIARADFDRLTTLDDVLTKLFGELK